jgi:hypothetical protein
MPQHPGHAETGSRSESRHQSVHGRQQHQERSTAATLAAATRPTTAHRSLSELGISGIAAAWWR